MLDRARRLVAFGGSALVAGSLVVAACTDFNGLTFPLDASTPGEAAARDGRPPDGPGGDDPRRDAGADAPVDARDAGCAGPHLYTYDGHCYRYVSVDAAAAQYSSAQSDCVAWGGYLVVMSGANAGSEHAFVTQSIVDVELPEEAGVAVWIGLERGADGGFEWVDGEPLVYEDWSGGSGKPDPTPDKACVVEWNARFSGSWDNYKCDNHYGYVCERDL